LHRSLVALLGGKQVLSALLVLSRNLLKVELPWLGEIVRPKQMNRIGFGTRMTAPEKTGLRVQTSGFGRSATIEPERERRDHRWSQFNPNRAGGFKSQSNNWSV